MKVQFFPSPKSLATKAVKKFKNRNVTRMLEPEAGRGDLADVAKDIMGGRWTDFPIDTIEIDFENQAILREKKYRVVGHDFLQYRGAALYSHILMNPPFGAGAAHVLHAWELLYHGELVAILNAETIRNPYSKERRYLVDLIELHGSVEFMQETFLAPDCERTTPVEIALIHMEKVSAFKSEFLDTLKKDSKKSPVDELHRPQDLIVSNTKIDNLVTAFDCAVKASKEAQFAIVRSKYYRDMLGRSITDDTTKGEGDYYNSAAEALNKEYQELKERAWSTILRSADVTNKLSSGAQKRLEADFKQVCELEFTTQNIAGFLMGLVQQSGKIQMEMVCDVFDLISQYHYDNRAYYQGWKSNNKHRVNAFRIMTTRFILPATNRSSYSWNNSLNWDDIQRFRDFDKVMAMLDGKLHDVTFGLEKLFDRDYKDLSDGERLSSDYFDVRFYPRAGTFHLFSRRKDLIDRLNRIVGLHRAWLPVDDTEASPEFWQQYDKAEAVKRHMDVRKVQMWRLLHGDVSEQIMEGEKLLAAHTQAMATAGIDYDASRALAYHTPPTQLLLEAC